MGLTCLSPSKQQNQFFHGRLQLEWKFQGGVRLRKSKVKNGATMESSPSTSTSRISTNIPLYETPRASFDQYLEDKPRSFDAIPLTSGGTRD